MSRFNRYTRLYSRCHVKRTSLTSFVIVLEQLQTYAYTSYNLKQRLDFKSIHCCTVPSKNSFNPTSQMASPFRHADNTNSLMLITTVLRNNFIWQSCVIRHRQEWSTSQRKHNTSRPLITGCVIILYHVIS